MKLPNSSLFDYFSKNLQGKITLVTSIPEILLPIGSDNAAEA
jgi:hypothetical protein